MTPRFLIAGFGCRLVALLLLVMLPILVAGAWLLSRNAADHLRLGSRRQADRYGQRPGQPGGAWSGDAVRDLQFLAGHPDLVSMDPARQRPLLEEFRKLYPQITYADTIGPNGIDVVRTDGKQPIDYYDRAYFRALIAGAPFAWETMATSQHGPSRAQPGGAHCRSRRQSRGGRGAGHGSGVAGPDGRGGEGRADGLFVRRR